MFFYTVMKTPIVYLLFMIVLYLSCSPRPQSPADIHTDLSNNKILQLSELFDRIRYIPLETPDTALIANVQSVTYHNGRYYLIAENTLYVFNRHGQYLSQHNNRGRGANEYSSIFKVKSSIGDSVIYVSGDNGKGHIVMAYDKNGNYLKTLIQNRSFNMEFNVLENSIIISDGRTVSLYDKLRKIIDNYLTNYDLNKKDSRYYIAKYPDSLQAMHDGHNIIFFEAGWDNYWIDVINKDRMSSYHINLFRYLVYKYYPLTKDFNQWLELKNGLTLDCAEQHGWCIKYSDKVKTEFVEEQFKGYPLKPNREEKLFFIPVDLKEDLIEAGIGILEKMTQIP